MKRLPNNYGSVVKLSGVRRRPWIVKKTRGWRDSGQPKYEIIGYAATREEGLAMLASYNQDPWDVDKAKLTLEQLYTLWLEVKAPKLGASLQHSLRTGYKHVSPLYGRVYRTIKAFEMQSCIDGCHKGASTQGSIKNLWRHLDRFAMELDIIMKRYSDLLVSEAPPETSRVPFSVEEIATLWEHQGDPMVDSILVLIYSGWRITEFCQLTAADIDLEVGTMKGGIKTAAGKNRIVPIHSRIRPLVERLLAANEGHLCPKPLPNRARSANEYRWAFDRTLKTLGMPRHTPHECRHTFETLLDNAGANRRCIDLMMGHSSRDTGNRVYNHKTIEDLKAAVELITI